MVALRHLSPAFVGRPKAGPLQLAVLLTSALNAATAAQPSTHGHASVPATVRERPIAIRTGIGSVHEPVTTSARQAQALYDQGLAFLHGYAWIEAERSFRQALSIDPGLVMAHVGLSYTGWELQGEEDARAALARARQFESRATERERRRIALRAQQLDAVRTRGDARLRTAYIGALDAALAAEKDNVEVLLLRAMADDPDPAGRGMGTSAGALPYLQRVLALSRDHPAAHHYLTHAYENAGQVEKALEHGAAYARLAPKIPHARHMYGHDLRRVGRVNEAIAEFKAAYDLETDAARVAEIPLEYDWHHPHNLDLLGTSYQYVGKMKSAEAMFRRSFELATPFAVQIVSKREWPAFLLARGRAADALRVSRDLTGQSSPIAQAVGRIMEGRSLAALGRYQEAATASNAAMKDLDRAGPAAVLAATDLKVLQAEFFVRTRQPARARPLVEDAVARLRNRPGPDAWTGALFTIESLARAACDAGDWTLASFLGDAMRQHDGAYAGTHLVLARIARAKPDPAVERRELDAARAAWSAADADLPELAEIAARLQALNRPAPGR
jgi:tetratricopeptide (TPR) repeat protein